MGVYHESPVGCQVGRCVGRILGLPSSGPITMQGGIGLREEYRERGVSGEEVGLEIIRIEAELGLSWRRVTRALGPAPLSDTGGSGDPTLSQASRVLSKAAPLHGGRDWPGYLEERAAELGGMLPSDWPSVADEIHKLEEEVVRVKPHAGEAVQCVQVSGPQGEECRRGKKGDGIGSPGSGSSRHDQ
ncbi:hypothetical protein AHAS_Ahas13G0277300 [Arachis hypogaea]